MKSKIGLLFIAAFLVFAIAGSVQAAYLTDGARITASGQWEVADPGYCTDGAADTVDAATGTFVKTTECANLTATYADSATCVPATLVAKCTDGSAKNTTDCNAAGYNMAKSRAWTSKDSGKTSGCYANFTNERKYGTGLTLDQDGSTSGNAVSYNQCMHCHNENYLAARIYCADSDIEHGTPGCVNRGDVKTDVYMADGHYYRAMEPFMQSGHKNVLRKVIPGGPMGGPLFTGGAGSAAYTGMDWATGKNTSNGANADVYYIYNSFFEAVKLGQLNRTTIADPTTVNQVSLASQVRGCFYCHTGGYGFADAQHGVGTSTKWAYNGIQCDTCHGALKDDPDAYGAAAGTTYGQHHAEYADFADPEQEHMRGTTATRMCMTCHRYESTSGPITDPAIQAGALVIEEIGSHHANFGGQFLNSPHARFTGTWGDITDPAAYDSHFSDHHSGVNSGCTGCHEAHVGGSSADVLDPTSLTSHMKPSGTCGISCHSQNPADPYNKIVSKINHPTGTGTPLDGDLLTDKGVMRACVTCHMGPTISHIWRINTDAAYETFDHTAGAPVTYDDGGYAAIGIDVDMACGQCHGGTAGSTATKNGAHYIPKAILATAAEGMHMTGVNASPIVDPTLIRPVVAAGVITDTTLPADDQTGVVDGTMFTLNTAGSFAVDYNGIAAAAWVNWGDGSALETGAVVGTFTHTYTNVGEYHVVLTVKDSLGYSKTWADDVKVNSASAPAGYGSVLVAVNDTSVSGTCTENVNVYLNAGHLRFSGATDALGSLTLPSVPGSMPAISYAVTVYAPFGCTCTTTVTDVTAGAATAIPVDCE